MPRYFRPRGYGWGFGRGWCWWPRRPWCWGWGGWGPPWMVSPYAAWWEEPPYESPQEEIADLKEQEAFLREKLDVIQQRLAELEKASQP